MVETLMFPKKDSNPFEIFGNWLEDAKKSAKKHNLPYPNKVCLATASKDGAPSSRMILLKEFDEQGFVFFTNYTSKKASDLEENPQASLCFYWEELNRQVRVNGSVKRVSDEESDEYFASRDFKSRIGAHASKQSQPLKGGTKELLARVAEKTLKFGMKEVPRPEFWGGYRVAPETIEFWQQGDFRIHNRMKFYRNGDDWNAEMLYP